jgi:fluoroacetyl-CoA thioesterase
MSDSAHTPLVAGLRHSQSVLVTDDLTPAHLRQDPVRVLSTPDMIRLVEQTAIEAVAPHLAPSQTTVGTRVDIAHLAATPVGMTVTITVELTEVDRRRLAFRVEVRDMKMCAILTNFRRALNLAVAMRAPLSLVQWRSNYRGGSDDVSRCRRWRRTRDLFHHSFPEIQ